ncbi:MAG: ATP-binding protein [Candidatus Omnitrophota bacterium]
MSSDALPDYVRQLTQTDLFNQISAICAAVNEETDSDGLLEVSLQRLLRLFGARRGSVYIFDESREELVLKSAIGLTVEEGDYKIKRPGEGVVGKVAELKKPIFVKDISTDERFENYKARSSYETPSFLCVPLLVKDELIGVINVADKESGTLFGEDELQLMDFLAAQIALNYRRIALYQNVQNIVERSRKLEDELGRTSEERSRLKRQVVVHERLASIGKLAGGIAHEFNNPLDGVMRYTQLCLQQVGDDGILRGYLLEIKHGLNRMANIVRSLLACSRGAAQGEENTIHPEAAIEQALQSIQTDAVHKNIDIKINVDAGLPEMTDMGLERILVNLLRNAVEAVDSGGEVGVSAGLEDGGQLAIRIWDDGPGIAVPDDLDKIFEPFYTTKDIEKGCGLGLTIVAEIVKMYDGKLTVESYPDKKTVFTIRLPVA